MGKGDIEEWGKHKSQARQTGLRGFANEAVIGSLFKLTEQIDSAKQMVMHLSTSVDKLNSSINFSFQNLHLGITSSTDRLSKVIDQEILMLSRSIETQAQSLIRSNERLSRSNESNARWMKWLTAGLVVTGLA